MNITWTFSPGAIIFASRFNQNFSDVKNWADNHELLTNGVHGIPVGGSFVGTNLSNSFTQTNSFNGPTTFNNGVDLTIPGLISNARFSYSAGVLRIVTESGATPTASNPVYFRYWANSLGRWQTLTFNDPGNCIIQDATSVDSYFYNGTIGTPFGTTSGVAWGQGMPMFIYAALASTGPILFLSRYPNLYNSPSNPNSIGYANNPPVDISESSVLCWSLVNPLTLAPSCQMIGYVTLTKNTNDDWTFFNPTTIPYGQIGGFNFENVPYIMPQGQNGASPNSYFNQFGSSTIPSYSSNFHYYKIDRAGKILGKLRSVNATGGTPGSGSDDMYVSFPFKGYGAASSPYCLLGNGLLTNGSNQNKIQLFNGGASTFRMTLEYVTGSTNPLGISTRSVSVSDQNQVVRAIQFDYAFQI